MTKAAAAVSTRSRPQSSAEITDRGPQRFCDIVSENGQAGSMSPFEAWPAGLDSHLRNILGSAQGAEREAISSVRALHPELPASLIWSRIVHLGLTDRKRPPNRRHEWTAEEDQILRSEYGRSRASSHDAIEKMLALHPDWSRNAIIWRARTLGLTQHRTPYQRWSSTLDHYLLSLMDCQLDTIAKRLKRSKKSVLARLRKLGWNADFFGGFKTKDLVLDLRVTEAEVNRWVRLGWLERKKGRITEESLRWLCRYHPDAIPFETLTLEAQNWLRLSMDYGRGAGVRHGGRKRKNSQSEALSAVRAEMAG